MNTDRFGLYYFDENSKGNEIIFPPSLTKKDKESKSKFYELLTIKNYLIKYSQNELNYKEIYKMLKLFLESQSNITLTDLPIAYYQENTKLKGTIIPYYQNSISLYRIINNNNLKYLQNYYHHDNDKLHNLYLLLNDILNILEELANNNIIYLDTNISNFVIKNNQIKLIDFEPQYIKYETNNANIKRLLSSFDDLLYAICSKLKLDNLAIYNSKSFKNTRNYLIKVENKIRKKTL